MRLIPFLLFVMFTAAAVPAETGTTEKQRAATRLALLDNVAVRDRLVLPAVGPTVGRVVIFTDTSCPFCAALHRQHEALLHSGIEVQYLFFPRSGPDSAAWMQAVSVWCAPNQPAALTAAIGGHKIEARGCEHPVAAHYRLARQLDLLGTPALILPDGTLQYGVRSIRDIALLARLQKD